MRYRMPTSVAGGNDSSAMRMARYVVPQKTHTAASATYARKWDWLPIPQRNKLRLFEPHFQRRHPNHLIRARRNADLRLFECLQNVAAHAILQRADSRVVRNEAHRHLDPVVGQP